MSVKQFLITLGFWILVGFVGTLVAIAAVYMFIIEAVSSGY
jgi:hypothetical protein